MINFLLNVMLHIAPHLIEDSESVPGSFPIPDFRNDALTTLKLHGKSTKDLKFTCPDLVPLLCGIDAHPAQSRLDLLATALQLLGKFSETYKGLEGFVELYTPVLEILQIVTFDGFPMELQVC